jgi:hypothetical protein
MKKFDDAKKDLISTGLVVDQEIQYDHGLWCPFGLLIG